MKFIELTLDDNNLDNKITVNPSQIQSILAGKRPGAARINFVNEQFIYVTMSPTGIRDLIND